MVDDGGKTTGGCVQHGHRFLGGPNPDIGCSKQLRQLFHIDEGMNHRGAAGFYRLNLWTVADKQTAKRLSLARQFIDRLRQKQRILIVSESASIDTHNIDISESQVPAQCGSSLLPTVE